MDYIKFELRLPVFAIRTDMCFRVETFHRKLWYRLIFVVGSSNPMLNLCSRAKVKAKRKIRNIILLYLLVQWTSLAHNKSVISQRIH